VFLVLMVGYLILEAHIGTNLWRGDRLCTSSPQWSELLLYCRLAMPEHTHREPESPEAFKQSYSNSINHAERNLHVWY
jgi:hypothetical protein